MPWDIEGSPATYNFSGTISRILSEKMKTFQAHFDIIIWSYGRILSGTSRNKGPYLSGKNQLGSVLFVSLHIIFSHRMLVRHNYEDMRLVNKSNIRDLFIIFGFATKHREFCPNVPECYWFWWNVPASLACGLRGLWRSDLH